MPLIVPELFLSCMKRKYSQVLKNRQSALVRAHKGAKLCMVSVDASFVKRFT